MTILHMHLAMVNKALMQAKYAEALGDTEECAARAREIVLSGAADPRSRWQPIAVTGADRAIAARLLAA